MWQIDFSDIAEHSLLQLDKPIRQRILKFFRERVEPAEDPTVLAERLSGELIGLYRFRVGDYRIICDIRKIIHVVEVLDMGHRSKIYKKIGR